MTQRIQYTIKIAIMQHVRAIRPLYKTVHKPLILYTFCNCVYTYNNIFTGSARLNIRKLDKIHRQKSSPPCKLLNASN